MPLIVEDGTGFANADSLASVEFADAFHAARGNELWATFSLPRKEQLLRLATDYIKYIFGPSLNGVKVFGNQSQPFPRIVDGVNIGNPIEVQEATVELAYIANSGSLLPTQTTIRKKMVKVGPIQVEYDTSSGYASRFVSATSRLAEFMTGRAASPITAKVIRT